MSDERSFVLDFKVTKQKALYDWALGLVDEVLNDKDQKRVPKEKFDTIRRIVLDATSCEEEI